MKNINSLKGQEENNVTGISLLWTKPSDFQYLNSNLKQRLFIYLFVCLH